MSQLTSNYDLKTDTYHTTWAEPGINCEACHGPSAEHNRVFREAPKGQKPEDIKIISWKNFTPRAKERRVLHLPREDVPGHRHLCAG